MALPKAMILVSEPSVEGGEARINGMAHIVTANGVIGGGISVTYTGSENLAQLKAALVNATIQMAAGQGVTLVANDIIVQSFEKG